MPIHIVSVKDLLINEVKAQYECMLEAAFKELVEEKDKAFKNHIEECMADWEGYKQDLKCEIKKLAASLAIELFSKPEMNGVSVEIKV